MEEGGVERWNATNEAGDRAYRIRVDSLCVSTKRFNTRRVTDSYRWLAIGDADATDAAWLRRIDVAPPADGCSSAAFNL